MNHVRLQGDPFGDDCAAARLRAFLRLALGSGLRCSLSLGAVTPRPPAPGEREVPLTDGVRELVVGTDLPPAELELLARAAGEAVASTAPVLVFAPAGQRADAVREAGLDWPQAAAVIAARDDATPAELVGRMRAELRWAATEDPPHALEERELAPWLALPPVGGRGPVLFAGDHEPADGMDLVLAVFAAGRVGDSVRLRLVLPPASAAAAAALVAASGIDPALVEVVAGPLVPAHARDVTAVVLPYRRWRQGRELVLALASGRPVCAARFAANAALLAAPGICLPIGGRYVAAGVDRPAQFAPEPAAISAALRQALADPAAAAAMGCRARVHVVAALTRGRPAAPPPAPARRAADRPLVVLEAPWFETSSSAELSIATAAALHARQRVELRLVPTVPLRQRLRELRARAPGLEPLLCRDPGPADLWLSSGWPPRAVRPPCRTWALRLDWEYGGLPLELLPHATDDADLAVVHSGHVAATLVAAGRDPARLQLLPHGVDASMRVDAPPDPELLAWKAGRPAVLFCGGMIWRKGFDVFLRAVLAARAAGMQFVVVVKTVGHDQHYGRFHLGELLQRFCATPGTPPVRLIGDDLSREGMASLYTACDLLLHPYRGEGFGLPVLEARACGLPVLATAGGATEALMDGPGAIRIPATRRGLDLPGAHATPPWVFEPSAVAAGELLAAALHRLPELRAEARASAASVAAAHSWQAAAEAIEALAYAAIAARNGPVGGGEQQFVLPRTATAPAMR